MSANAFIGLFSICLVALFANYAMAAQIDPKARLSCGSSGIGPPPNCQISPEPRPSEKTKGRVIRKPTKA